MDPFKVTFLTRWADFDANKHMRHSAYNDYGAECRVRFFKQNSFGFKRFEIGNFCPILFKEEVIFFREIKLSEDISVDLRLAGVSAKAERFKMQHRIYREDGILAAEVNIFAAWLNLETRKLMTPPEEAIQAFNTLERTEHFEDIILKK